MILKLVLRMFTYISTYVEIKSLRSRVREARVTSYIAAVMMSKSSARSLAGRRSSRQGSLSAAN